MESIEIIDNLRAENEKLHNQLMETEKDAQNKIEELESKIEELESELESKDNLIKIKNGLLGNSDELPDEPISVANMLINAKTGYEPTPIQKAFGNGNCIMRDKYSDDDLEEIAEHLLVYCKHKREEYEQ